MRIVVSGGAGYIGHPLCESLARDGHSVAVLTRDPSKAHGRQTAAPGVQAIGWDPYGPVEAWGAAVRGCDAVIHLAGRSIAEAHWTSGEKQAIFDSRVGTAEALVGAIRAAPAAERPTTLLSMSAVGYYGPRGDDILDESSAPGSDFFAQVCQRWEAAAQAAGELGLRVVMLRSGIVLGPGDELSPFIFARRLLAREPLLSGEHAGVLQVLALLYRMGAGGRLGTGRQWWSWIHRDDLVGLIRFALEREGAHGALNAVAPEPVRQDEFGRALGRVLHRPHLVPAPTFALRLALGEAADALLLTSQRTTSRAALAAGYTYQHPYLDEAIAASLGRPS